MDWIERLNVGDVLALLVGVSLMWVALGPIRRLVIATSRFMGDWTGQPARPGRDAVPGVLEQIAHIRDMAGAAQNASEDAAKNSKPNGGSSAYDELIRRFDDLERQNNTLEQVMETSIADRKIIHQQLDGLSGQIERGTGATQ